MNDMMPSQSARDRYQQRLYTIATAAAGFLAGMLANNWIERRLRAAPEPPRSGERGR